MRMTRPAIVLGLGLAGVFAPRSAEAEPQATLGLTAGAAGRGEDRELFAEPAFHLGLRGDFMFGRTGVDSFGVGPYLETLTHNFDELQLGTGVSVLFPVFDAFPLILSTGIYGRYADDRFGFEPGVATSVFMGTRSYNFSSWYSMSFGVVLQARVGLGDSGETSFVAAIQFDAAFAGSALVYVIDAIRGGSPDTDPVPRAEEEP